jgi:uncharacterized membrane protein
MMQEVAAAQRQASEKDEEMNSIDAAEGDAGAANSSATAPVAARFWEVDSWRGVAIITMIIFHLVYDLRAYGGMPIVLHQGFWFYFQRFTAISFIALSGVSVVLSYSRALAARGSAEGMAWKIVRRGLHVLGIGLIFTVVMRVGGFGRIDFGVLHLIGTSIICSIPFLNSRRLTLATVAALYALSYALKFMGVQAPAGVYWLAPLGIEPPDYFYADYFPFLHWFAVFLIGVYLGNALYQNGARKWALPNFEAVFPFSFLQLLGRHSLVIYVIHQPILIGLLLLTGSITFG